MRSDYHIHTEFSDDSEYKIEELVNDAILLGINEICFTDHVDYGIKVDWSEAEYIQYRYGMPMANVDYSKYFSTIDALKVKYKELITLRTGMEFGVQVHTIEKYRSLFEKYHFDFIILSCHQVEDKEFWNQAFQENRSQEEYQERYYQEILNVIRVYKDYSVIGHLDLLKRYDKKGDYPFEKIKPLIEEILKQVINDGKGIEVNTSSFYYGLGDLMPSRDILRLYYELGGRIITIGSDTHKKEHLGYNIEVVKEELKNIGFKYHCTFDSMIPIYHEL